MSPGFNIPEDGTPQRVIDPPLEYSPGTLAGRWRRTPLIIAMTLCAAFAVWHCGRPLFEHSVLLYWQRRCLNHSLPPGQVVYDDDGPAAAELVARGRSYHFPQRPCFNTLDNLPPKGWRPPAYYRPREYEKVSPRDFADGVGFLHSRRTPSGQERLVIFELGSSFPYPDGNYAGGGSCEVLNPASWGPRSGLRAIPQGRQPDDSVLLHVKPPQRLRIFAGQPDPKDSSRFSVIYEIDGKRGTIEGRLNDADQVILRILDGPAAPPDDMRPGG